MGRVDTTWIPAAGRSTIAYGVLNQVLSEKDPLGYTTTQTYDPASLAVVRVVDPRGLIYKFGYNAIGASVAAFGVADTTTADSVGYDVGGNVRRVKTKRGDVVLMTYDLDGRLLSRSGPDFPADSFRYDVTTQRWSVAWNANGYDSLVTDNAGRLVTSIQKLAGTSYTGTLTYNNKNQLLSRALLQGSGYTANMTYHYTVAGIVDSLCANLQCVSLRRSPDVTLDTVIYRAGQTGSWWMNQLFDASHALSFQRFSPYTLNNALALYLGRDSLGRVKSRRVGVGSLRMFSYDGHGWLLNACDSIAGQCVNVNGQAGVNAWSYDSSGNRTTNGNIATYGLGNRLLSYNNFSYQYNNQGEQVSVSSIPLSQVVAIYDWDALGRLRGTRDANGNTIASFDYDALGRRVRKGSAAGSQRYAYVGDQVVLDVDGITNAVQNEYAWYPGTDNLLSVKNTAWPNGAVAIADPINGTVRGLADFNDGSVKKVFSENPWGDNPADTGVAVRFRFAGSEFDPETGLYYMRARYYNPSLGRFISEDPIGLEGGGNLFAYANSDPVNLRDPSGLIVTCRLMAWTITTRGATTGTIFGSYVDHYFWQCSGSWDLPDFGGCPGQLQCELADPASIAAAEAAFQDFLNKYIRTLKTPTPTSTRSFGQCLKENTAPVNGALKAIGVGVALAFLGKEGLETFSVKAIAEGTIIKSGVDPYAFEEGTKLVRIGEVADAAAPYVGVAGVIVAGSTAVYYPVSAAICAISPHYGE
jgi:RHS repeat-associated protein